MRLLIAAHFAVSASLAQADISCALNPTLTDRPSTLLIREVENQAVILVSGRTLIFECPPNPVARGYECYGHSKPPVNAPMQLNVAAEAIAPGAPVVVTTRNLFFGDHSKTGTHRRHASVRVYTIEACNQPSDAPARPQAPLHTESKRRQ